MASGLPAFIEEVPDYTVRDGRMYIGMGGLVIAMPIHVFLEGCVKGKAAVAQWQVAECDKNRSVVPFKGG